LPDAPVFLLCTVSRFLLFTTLVLFRTAELLEEEEERFAWRAAEELFRELWRDTVACREELLRLVCRGPAERWFERFREACLMAFERSLLDFFAATDFFCRVLLLAALSTFLEEERSAVRLWLSAGIASIRLNIRLMKIYFFMAVCFNGFNTHLSS